MDDNLSQISNARHAPDPLKDRTPRVAASIKKPIHNVKDAGKPRVPGPGSLRAGFRVFIPGISVRATIEGGGAYRDRTDDLKLAKLALSQLS